MTTEVESGDSDLFPSSKRAYGDLKAKRTESLPKHSLFGTTLERLTETEKQQLRDLDINKFCNDIDKERQLRERRYKLTIPEHLQQQISDKSLKQSKQELIKQAQEAENALKTVDALEEKSRYFALDPTERQLPSAQRGRESEWMNQQEQARYINSIDRGDKLKNRTAVHFNKDIGGKVQYGMDFPFTMPSSGKRPYYQVEHVGPPDRLPREFYMKKDTTDDGTLAVKLPPNIKHQFGTKICEQVLSDPEKVHKTIEKQKKQEEALLKISQLKPRRVALDIDVNPEYQSLGDALRQDLFPGYTINHKKSTTKSAYTADVYKNRVDVPDEYRYKRDDLGTWNEMNVLQERMKQAWNTYLEQQRNLQPNWKSNNSQLPAISKAKIHQPKPNSKPKPKRSKTKSKEKSGSFENIEFVTPPLTPPQTVPQPAVLDSAEVKRDDEFWEFYEKGT